MSVRGLAAVLICCALSVTLAHAATPPAPRDVALGALNYAKSIWEKVCEASPQPGATILPAGVEVRMTRALVLASDVLTKGDDRELLTALLAYTAASRCSADRSRALSLVRIFRARPEAVQTAIAALPADARCNVVAQLHWGWTNDFLPASTQPSDRETRLTKLKDSVPAKCLQ